MTSFRCDWRPATRLVGEPLGHEPFDVLRVSSRVEKLEAEWLKSCRSAESKAVSHGIREKMS